MRTRAWIAAAVVAVGGGLAAWSMTGRAAAVRPYPYRIPKAASPDAEIAFVERRVKANPDGALDLAALAGLYLKKSKTCGGAWTEKAAEAARLSLEKMPFSNTGAKLVLATIAQSRHHFAECRRLCEEVLAESPRNEDAVALLITTHVAIGSVEEAQPLADRLVDALPTTASWSLHGLVMAARGRDREAVHDFTRAIEAEEFGQQELSAQVRAWLGRHHFRRGRFRDARECLEAALAIDAANPIALGALGELDAREGRVDEAERCFSAAFHLSKAPVWIAKKAALKGGAEGDELYALAEKMMREEPFGHATQLARLLLDRGRNAEALEVILAESKRRRDAETLDVLALALLRANRAAEARDVMREALGRFAEPSLYGRAAEVERALGAASRAALYEEMAR